MIPKEIMPELAMKIVQRLIKMLKIDIDIDCCETEDQIYHVIVQTVRCNRYQALNWKAYKNNIDYKVI